MTTPSDQLASGPETPAGPPPLEAAATAWSAPAAAIAPPMASSGRRDLAVVAGILAVSGGIGLVAGAFLPITTGDQGFAIFQPGPDPGLTVLFAVEPIVTGVFAGLLGLVVLTRAIRPTLAGGMLIGLGIAETLAYGAYLGLAVGARGDLGGDPSAGLGLGALVGLAGALLTTVGGCLALSSTGPV
ncbi:MAG TPA: hypothetical protein VMH24_05135 [Candidatus Sulfotelmatobacter sp.]|nr:hypothetical protein [Candidatus Sulfotelmatobacter sp.]